MASSPMTRFSMAKILNTTSLAGRKIIDLPLVDGRVAWAVEASPGELEKQWKCAHALLSLTHHWPLVVTSWGGEQLEANDLFNRFFFKEEPGSLEDVSPLALISRSRQVNIDEVWEQLGQRPDELSREEIIEIELSATKAAFGVCPSTDEAVSLFQGAMTSEAIDQKLHDWEVGHGLSWSATDGQVQWFEPTRAWIVFLPTVQPWESLAYMHWYGCLTIGTPAMIAIGRQWELRYGAVPWAHYGTMLQCHVETPPSSEAAAHALAHQHALVAPYTLIAPGLSLRQYAAALRVDRGWFLHERP